MITTLENETQKSMTRPCLSVHQRSFLCAFCQELRRSTTQRLVEANGAGLPFSEITPTKPSSRSRSRVGPES